MSISVQLEAIRAHHVVFELERTIILIKMYYVFQKVPYFWSKCTMCSRKCPTSTRTILLIKMYYVFQKVPYTLGAKMYYVFQKVPYTNYYPDSESWLSIWFWRRKEHSYPLSPNLRLWPCWNHIWQSITSGWAGALKLSRLSQYGWKHMCIVCLIYGPWQGHVWTLLGSYFALLYIQTC